MYINIKTKPIKQEHLNDVKFHEVFGELNFTGKLGVKVKMHHLQVLKKSTNERTIFQFANYEFTRGPPFSPWVFLWFSHWFTIFPWVFLWVFLWFPMVSPSIKNKTKNSSALEPRGNGCGRDERSQDCGGAHWWWNGGMIDYVFFVFFSDFCA